jgi:hypothetical protein
LVADIALELYKIAPGGTQMTYHAGPDFNPAQFPLMLDTIFAFLSSLTRQPPLQLTI